METTHRIIPAYIRWMFDFHHQVLIMGTREITFVAKIVARAHRALPAISDDIVARLEQLVHQQRMPKRFLRVSALSKLQLSQDMSVCMGALSSCLLLVRFLSSSAA
jgi:hypothetical protein